MPSVVRDWVSDLSFREQGCLLTAIRGDDQVPKEPMDSAPRHLVGWLRYTIMHPADEREVGIHGAFMQSTLPDNWKSSELGHLSMHFYSHLMHAFEVVGWRHPDDLKAKQALGVYIKLSDGLHLEVESFYKYKTRMEEDRIASGRVVS